MRYSDPHHEIRKCSLLSPILAADKTLPPYFSTNMPLKRTKMSPQSGPTMSVGSAAEPLPNLTELEPLPNLAKLAPVPHLAKLEPVLRLAKREPVSRLAKLEPRMLCPIHNHSNGYR